MGGLPFNHCRIKLLNVSLHTITRGSTAMCTYIHRLAADITMAVQMNAYSRA